jgi:hypothetical protein
LSLLAQAGLFLRSYKRTRAQLVLNHYLRLTPRNGKYTPEIAAARQKFEAAVLDLRARRCSPEAAAQAGAIARLPTTA